MRNLINELGNFSIDSVKYDNEMSKSEKVCSSKTYIMASIYETSLQSGNILLNTRKFIISLYSYILTLTVLYAIFGSIVVWLEMEKF
ncbi:hypothetical protein [Spiroplasma turonicum]|uniref:Uncharacterized protein n=1 Tax=Spiroplasma turonicum TaxID=216946 RepID=A0A0K1P6Y9_9MOLU|nr:hypothetical protein [Spiroplasma turonicum]AKU80063.1 hypothetical protein STURON_00817 [Spiroplasma turonicum]ALX71065.1 hypothetical protein STURO_v1c08140 [Spiroplasma turonicum]